VASDWGGSGLAFPPPILLSKWPALPPACAATVKLLFPCALDAKCHDLPSITYSSLVEPSAW
jgi:hypothetical protein